MKKIFFIACSVVFALQISSAGHCASDDQKSQDYKNDPYNPSVKTAYGVRFYAPQDMPIMKKGGLITPVDTYEYIGVEVSKLKKRIEKLENDLDEIKAELAASKNGI